MFIILLTWQKCQHRGINWRGLMVGCTLAGMSPVLIVYLKVGKLFIVYKYEKWVIESIVIMIIYLLIEKKREIIFYVTLCKLQG
jgi:hypothetical protein